MPAHVSGPDAAALAMTVQSTSGSTPLLVLTDESGQALVLTPTADGTQLVLGSTDRDGDQAALVLTDSAVAALGDACARWRASQP